MAEDHRGGDPEQPTQHRDDEDDPHERGMIRADDPAQLHLPRVGNRKRDDDDEQRHERERPDVEADAVAVPAQTRAARLAGFGSNTGVTG